MPLSWISWDAFQWPTTAFLSWVSPYSGRLEPEGLPPQGMQAWNLNLF